MKKLLLLSTLLLAGTVSLETKSYTQRAKDHVNSTVNAPKKAFVNWYTQRLLNAKKKKIQKQLKDAGLPAAAEIKVQKILNQALTVKNVQAVQKNGTVQSLLKEWNALNKGSKQTVTKRK